MPCQPLGTPLGYGKGKRGKFSWSFHPISSWFQMPGSAECWLKGQFGDRDTSWAQTAELLLAGNAITRPAVPSAA